MSKIYFIFLIFIVVVLAGCSQQIINKQVGNVSLVGNDKDAHGCIPSAGYSWCESLQKCVRPWEEPCHINEMNCTNSNGNSLSLQDAILIAKTSECNNGLTSNVACNNITGTYWIDLNVTKKGCAPACVVDIATKTAEINWRCTGLLS